MMMNLAFVVDMEASSESKERRRGEGKKRRAGERFWLILRGSRKKGGAEEGR
jgi:hypothetical protein